MLRRAIIINFIITSTLSLHAQRAFDTLLFRIPLIDDTSCQSLFSCHEAGQIRKTLSGPVIMKNNSLLFYSENGYILYNQKGTVIDSHSVYQKNRDLPKEDPKRVRLAFPADKSTILYYQKVKKGDYPVAIYEKRLFKNRLKPLKEKQYKYYLKLEKEHLFNLAHNSVTDDMAFTYFALPHLIGFTSVATGSKWWSIDRFYSFTSPLIIEKNGKFRSLFPGIRAGDVKRNQQLVNPVQVFKRDKNWYYTGVHSIVGTAEEQYLQTFYVCDLAGNILYSDNFLKQTNRDAIIGEDEDTYYTVKKVEKYVFQPAVDKRGNMYYGIIDYVKKYIKVRKRSYYGFKAFSTEPDLAHLIDVERSIEYKPVSIPCNRKLPGGKTIPNVTVLTERGKRIIAKARHLTKDGYIVRISRSAYRDIDKKLVRSRASLPEEVKAIKDSLSDVSTMSCPYTISLSGPKGMIRTFNYPPGTDVLCARVLVLRKSGEVVIRVDCKRFAEILIFKTDGSFVNRFVFNRHHYKKRKDIVAATNRSPIIELDYEADRRKEKFQKWEKVVLK